MEDFIIKDLGKPHDSEVYHYTKLENLFKIITEKGLVFHASRFDVMNDPEDTKFQNNYINKLLEDNGLIQILGEFGSGEASPFIVSFSCSKDDAMMWRLYDADVFLHIDTKIIYDYCENKACKHTFMGKVTYGEIVKGSKADLKINEVLNARTDQRDFEADVYLSLYKHQDFEKEDEWRLMCFGKDEICSEIKAKGTRYNQVWLYREVCLPKECLKGITLRVYKSNVYASICEQIEAMLKQYNYSIEIIEFGRTKTKEVR